MESVMTNKIDSKVGAFACASSEGYQKGITKREYFAAMAMDALIQSAYTTSNAEHLAKNAICYADALLKELEQSEGEGELTKLSKNKNEKPNPRGSWGIGMYSTQGNGEVDGYGFYRPENPNNFFPDFECCQDWEIENHKLACELYNKELEQSDD